MKIFLISNTQFGYKEIYDDQFDYFNNKIIPFINEKFKDGDIFVHAGNIFNNKKNVNLNIINKTMDIVEKISSILPFYIINSKNDENSSLLFKRIKNVEIINDKKIFDNVTLVSYNNNMLNLNKNDIIIFNKDYMENPNLYKKILKNYKISICSYYEDKKIFDNNIINIGSPYQLNKSHINKKGILLIDIDKKKTKLLENNYSPKFLNLEINEIDNIEKIKINEKDIITLKINEKLINKKENLNKLKLLINKFNFQKIIYIKNENNIVENIINLNDNNLFNIKKIIEDYIIEKELNIENELNDIYKIYNNKFFLHDLK